jgi:hypothetical protein
MFALTGYLGVQGFAHAFDSVAGSGAYVALLAKGQAAGYKAAPFSLSQSLLAVPFVLFFIYGYTPMGLAGEMKTVRKSLIAAMLLASFVSWLAIMVMALIYYPILGVDFAHTIAYLAAMNPTASPFGSAPTLNNILAYVYGNTPLIAVLNLGIALNAFILVPQTMLFCIRHIFSWSFDRVVPAKLAEVSRFRTPWITALIVFVGMELMVVLYIFTGLIAALLNSAVLATPLGIGAGIIGPSNSIQEEELVRGRASFHKDEGRRDSGPFDRGIHNCGRSRDLHNRCCAFPADWLSSDNTQLRILGRLVHTWNSTILRC